MGVYHRFEKPDIIHYSLITSPLSRFASGSRGWRGSTGTSGSISMYGGIRAKESSDELSIRPIHDLETYTIDGKIQVSSSYPYSGSISYVRVIDRTLDLNDEVHSGLWGKEHFSPILNLYDYYGRVNTDYTTSSYDYYMIYSERDSLNKVTYSGSFSNLSSSYTIEALVKPLSTEGSGNHIIASRTDLWKFYVNDDGLLAFSASDGRLFTSSLSIAESRWQHVSYRVNDDLGKFTINLLDAGQHQVNDPLVTGLSEKPINFLYDETSNRSFHGFAYDFRVWKVERSFDQLSSSFNCTIKNSGSDDLVIYSRFNDGPRSTSHGYTRGSGAFDYSQSENHGLLQNFDSRTAPIWHPNDNHEFITSKSLLNLRIDEFRVIHVPSMFYGRQIATGSVHLECNAFLSSSLKRVLVDDGRGGLFLSGSAASSSMDNREDYQGVKWNKVGNVFYSEGLIVIKDPALLDFGYNNPDSQLQDDILTVEFKGFQSIPSKVFMCRVNGAEANFSSNSSFTERNEKGKLERVRDDNTTWITGVGLYNKERKLVAAAKLANPIRNREKDKVLIRLKMDF